MPHPAPFVSERFDNWQAALPTQLHPPAAQSLPLMMAVGGGKGGVGKSVVSANLAGTFAQLGYRVLVVDLDFGCANLHTHFGIGIPKKTLTHFIAGQVDTLSDIILPAPIQGVAFIAGSRDEGWQSKLSGNPDKLLGLWDGLIRSRQQHKVDIVIMDLGAGSHEYTTDFFLSAHMGLVTVLPEPTSIENVYAFLKASIWKLIANVAHKYGHGADLDDVYVAMEQAGAQDMQNGYVDTLRSLRGAYPEFINKIAFALRGRYVGVIVNQARDQSDMDIGKSMEHICTRYFGLQTKSLGSLNYDQCVWKSLRNRRLLLTDFPHSLICKRLQQVAVNTLKTVGIQGVGHGSTNAG